MSTADDPPSHPNRSLFQVVPACPQLLIFQVFNSISFQIALGPPLILLARHYGASPTYIGFLVSLVPLLTILQLFMAPRVEYIGFRRLMLSGWTGRNLVLVLAAGLPWLMAGGYMDNHTLLIALFVFMVIYNFLRGLATASWMPWITHLVPEAYRGRYVSLEQFIVNLCSAGTFAACGWLLSERPGDIHFGLLWTVAAISGAVSLYFLKHIESPAPRPGKPFIEPFWIWMRRVWRDRSFRRLLRMNIAFSLGIAAWGGFTIVFLRDMVHLGDGTILYMSAVQTLGSMLSSWGWGTLVDRFGARPVMALATRLILIVMICWLLLSMGLFFSNVWAVAVLYILFGIGFIGFIVGDFGYCMNNAPRSDPVLALTMFSVLTSICNALAPQLWGIVLSRLDSFRWVLGVGFTSAASDAGPGILGAAQFNQFSIFYGATVIMIILTKVLNRRLPDQRAHATHLVLYHMMTDYPLRTINALYKSLFSRARENGAPEAAVAEEKK